MTGYLRQSPEFVEHAMSLVRVVDVNAATLTLFGAPHLDRIIAGYNDTVPLAAGWKERIPLHQLHPLLVHACLFGASYRDAVCSAARAL